MKKSEALARINPKRSVFDYEDVVSEVEEAMALAYFVYEAQKDEYLDGKAVRGVYRLLDRLSQQVKELFDVACDVERELIRIKEGS